MCGADVPSLSLSSFCPNYETNQPVTTLCTSHSSFISIPFKQRQLASFPQHASLRIRNLNEIKHVQMKQGRSVKHSAHVFRILPVKLNKDYRYIQRVQCVVFLITVQCIALLWTEVKMSRQTDTRFCPSVPHIMLFIRAYILPFPTSALSRKICGHIKRPPHAQTLKVDFISL